MHTSRHLVALALAVTAPLSAQTAGSAVPSELSLYTLRLQHISGQELAPALQQVVATRGVPERPTSSRAVDTLRITGRTVLVDSAFRAAVAAERMSMASSTSAQFVRVVAEPATNSLLVRSSPYDLALMKQIVARLDR